MESPEKKTLSILTEEPKRARFSSSGMSFKGLFAAVSYMASAVLLVIFNKAALSSFSFPSANVITLLQNKKRWKTFVVEPPEIVAGATTHRVNVEPHKLCFRPFTVDTDHAAIGARTKPLEPTEVSHLRARELHAPPPEIVAAAFAAVLRRRSTGRPSPDHRQTVAGPPLRRCRNATEPL
ncbi:hypothetical protein F2Q70_00029740 [Brassica cretica]|uniref:Uncharacterized protein n=1 Tax=Brassica cretica TaxID=69181 RepID=A0A8S9FKU2_BRACR|nr:hypothetical protein F2Q70_00029740 [Brassica cretica]